METGDSFRDELCHSSFTAQPESGSALGVSCDNASNPGSSEGLSHLLPSPKTTGKECVLAREGNSGAAIPAS